jgi:hypothetical protein
VTPMGVTGPRQPGAGALVEPPPVPEGMEVRISKHGTPYFAPIAADMDDEVAQNEHVRANMSVFAGKDDIIQRYGIGIWLYFDFIKFLALMNLIMFGIGLINWVPHMLERRSPLDPGEEVPLEETDLDFLFASSYRRSMSRYYFPTTALGIVFGFCIGPLYYLRVRRFYAARAEVEHKRDEFAGTDVDIIRANVHYSPSQRSRRVLGSYLLFALSLAISGSFTFLITKAFSGSSASLTSFLASLVVSLSNYAWKRVCVRLTEAERHATWSRFRKHATVKFFGFKMLNMLVLYVAKELAGGVLDTREATSVCVLAETGNQFFFLLLLDVTLFNIVEVVAPLIAMRLKGGKGKGDDEARPEFDLSEEFLELLYRHTIVLLGMGSFPIIAGFGMVANMLEYRVDLFRLTRICQKPKVQRHSLKRFIVFFLFVTSVAALASWPNGTAWVLSSKRSKSGYANCLMWPKG